MKNNRPNNDRRPRGDKPAPRNSKGDFKKYPKKNNRRFNSKKNEPLEKNSEFDWPIRLNRYISNSGICSRREADDLILEGKITVNGKVVKELGTKVEKYDKIKYNGRDIVPEKFVYLLLNKPKNHITTTSDESGRTTVMDLIGEEIDVRVYPVGRLDRNTTGVLLLTNDGELSQKLTHPSFNIRKIYEVTLDKKADVETLEKLVNGVELEDGVAYADTAAFPDPKDKFVIGLEIHSGRNRIVRRMFYALGFTVKKLDRVMFGPFTKKGVERGKYRQLKSSEIAQIKRAKKELK